MYTKDYDRWANVKKTLNAAETSTHIRSGEVRWVALGVNIGGEIDGKGKTFTRPCLVLHVIGKHLALVAPLTSQEKANKQFYLELLIHGNKSSICLSQMRVVSQKRIFTRLVNLPKNTFRSLKKEIFSFYGKGDL